LKIYTVHRPPFSAGRHAEPLLLREGFNFAAAIFGPFWALANRLWWTAFGLLVAGLALQTLLAWVDPGPAVALAVALGYAAIVGYMANDWRRMAIERDGWDFDGVVAAPGADAALRRLVDLAG
jgi:hypothetical protein